MSPHLIPRSELNKDLALFDRLGPLAREVFAQAPKDTNVGNIVSAWNVQRRREMWKRGEPQTWPRLPEPHEPEGDRDLANFALKLIRDNFPGFEPIARGGPWPRTSQR